MRLNIVYTSDVHGQITSTNYALNQKDDIGLSRLATYLKNLNDETVLLDNGDFLQGSIILDYYRKYVNKDLHPMIKAFNLLKYDAVNLGNHDFNYGQEYLNRVLDDLTASVVCANVIKDHKNLYKPYIIKQLRNGKKIGIIGIVTQYIPHWEKPDHIEGLTFLNAYDSTKKYVQEIRDSVDYVVVLYHGGFEKDLITQQAIGRPTEENMGYRLSQIKDIDLLLCGHQHMPTIYQNENNTIVLQTAANVKSFGHVTIDFDEHSFTHKGELMKNHYADELSFINTFKDLESKTQAYLDRPISNTIQDMTITSQLDARKVKHPMFQFINQLQLSLSSAQISAASLPNEAIGFKETIRLRDVAANFVYPNTIQVLDINGLDLKKALERTAEYFTIDQGEIAVDASFLYPKVEHYNYDVFDGIDYEFDLTKEKGNRLTKASIDGEEIEDEKHYTMVLNNYRAQGGGDYPMYQNARLIKEYTVSMFDLVVEYLQEHPTLEIDIVENFTIKTR